MLQNGIKYIGFLAMLMFGGIFIFRWFLRDELLLDQLIGFVAGSILFIVSFFVKRNYLSMVVSMITIELFKYVSLQIDR
ncbi:hypothetical protein [Lysinibacillus xylanilyticus]|uniref:hypothetical protein n=1 Tax=Lysinibacillus xylanilyticus TaxID=582475 RepID=UPI003D03A283